MESAQDVNVCLIWEQQYTALVNLPLSEDTHFLPVVLKYMPELEYEDPLLRKVLKKNTGNWAIKNLKHYKSSSLCWTDAFRVQQQQHTFRKHPKHPYSPLRHEHVSHAARAAAIIASIRAIAKKE